MPNIKEINWDEIRAYYVTSKSYPSYDDVSAKYDVTKKLIIAVANDRENEMNNGKTWQEQRATFAMKKQQMSENEAISEHKKLVREVVDQMDSITRKVFKLVSKDLDVLLREQQKAEDAGELFPLNKFIKLGDVAKLAESMTKISQPQKSDDGGGVLTLKISNQETKSLSDLSDEELSNIEYQVATGDIFDA